jgi:hypothetical protein
MKNATILAIFMGNIAIGVAFFESRKNSLFKIQK